MFLINNKVQCIPVLEIEIIRQSHFCIKKLSQRYTFPCQKSFSKMKNKSCHVLTILSAKYETERDSDNPLHLKLKPLNVLSFDYI